MSIELTIAVLTYNGNHLLPNCLASIDAQEIPCTYEKLIIDNGSDEPQYNPQNGWQTRHYAQNNGNIGGQNRCFQQACGTWVLFVANDVQLQENCILNLWHFTNCFTQLGQVQPELFKRDGLPDNFGLQWKWPGYGTSIQNIYRVNLWRASAVTSTCYLMKKELWREIGGFDETLRSSHEDIDMGLRLESHGFFCYINPLARAIHFGNQTLKHTITNPRKTFHEARVKVVRKHYRGLDRLTRLAAIHLLDALPRF